MIAQASLLFLVGPLCLAFAQPTRVGISSSRDLTLDDAIVRALRDNLDVQIERTNVSSANQAALGAHGFLDPVFHWNSKFQVLNTPSPSVLAGEYGKLSEHDLDETFGIHQRAWRGSVFDLSFDSGRTATNNPYIGLNPYLTSQLTLGITQPLLRGRVIDADRAMLRIRSLQTGIAKTELELRAIGIVSGVEQAYWDLVAARDSAAVSREAADLARAQLDQNRRMLAAGTLAVIELSASEAELERRLDGWYSSLDTITVAENNLKMLIAPRREDPLWSQELLPAETSNQAPEEAGELSTAVSTALKMRPELREIGEQQKVNGIEQQQNVDQIKPALNLVASYSDSGLAGNSRPTPDPFTAAFEPYAVRINELSTLGGMTSLPVPSIGSLGNYQSGGYGTSLKNLFTGRYQSVQAGVNLEWTVHNRQARADLEQSAIGAKKLKLQRVQMEQSIEAQVRNALQSLKTARQRIIAAEAGVHAAKEKLESEQRLFANGESTNFLVLTRQNEYSDARQRLLVARLDFNEAVSRFENAEGETLTARKLAVQ